MHRVRVFASESGLCIDTGFCLVAPSYSLTSNYELPEKLLTLSSPGCYEGRTGFHGIDRTISGQLISERYPDLPSITMLDGYSMKPCRFGARGQ
jgi:hypothetical protein